MSGAFKWAAELIRMGLSSGPMALYVDRPRRSLEQNDLLWKLLRDVSEQVRWHETKMSPENWKDVFTAAIKKQKLVPGLDGGWVVIGGHTSKMNRTDFSELLELIQSFGAEHDVKWTKDETGP